MYRHLVAVEVGVESGANQRMDLDGAPVDEDRLERLDAKAVQGRCAVDEHGTGLDHLVQYVPHLWPRPLYDAFGHLDVVRHPPRHEGVHDERLEELQGHALGQAALVEFELWADDDDGAPRVVDALTQQVLAEATLLALQHVRERLQLMVAGARHGTPTPAVIDQAVHGFLEHAFFVADDDLRRSQLQESLEAVVPVDDATVEIVQIAGGEAATVELNHGPQVRREDRQDGQDGPFRFVAAPVQRFRYLQALGRLLPTLPAGCGDLFVQPQA